MPLLSHMHVCRGLLVELDVCELTEFRKGAGNLGVMRLSIPGNHYLVQLALSMQNNTHNVHNCYTTQLGNTRIPSHNVHKNHPLLTLSSTK